MVSFGGHCQRYSPDERHQITITTPPEYQGDHEEADTLIAFHVATLRDQNIVIRATDIDVLVILIGFLGGQQDEVRKRTNIIMDCAMGKNHRYINVSNIANVLEEKRPGLSRALPGYHAFTGCDLTSAFYR